MKRYESEEYISSEFQTVEEIKIFVAEEYKTKELINNTQEEFKVEETEIRVVDETKEVKKIDQSDTFRNKLNNIQSSISTSATSIVSTSVVLVAAVGIGVVNLEPIVDDLGSVEFVNYYVDYQQEEFGLSKDVRIHFKNDLNDGFYTIVINKENNEQKELIHNYISFENVNDESFFEVRTLDEKENIVDSFEITVNAAIYDNYLGVGSMQYDLSLNEDETHKMKMMLDEYDNQLIPQAHLTDKYGNDLDYSISIENNALIIDNIKEEEFDIHAALYEMVDGNYYSVYNYQINNFNVNNPNKVNFKRVEILNSTYSTDGSIPTQLYFDGYLSEKDKVEVTVYSQTLEEIINVEVLDLKCPLIFSDLPTDEAITFEYTYYHQGNVIGRGQYQTMLNIPPEYLDIEYEMYNPNPGDALITYNDDGTYNAYFYNNFSHSSEYEVVFKTELAIDMIPYYEYIGNDKNAAVINIEANQSYSVIHKVLVKDGINYYSIYNFYLASGSIDIMYDEDKFQLNSGVQLNEIDNKQYSVYCFAESDSDLEIVATLSTGQVVKFQVSKESANDYGNPATIDLSAYDYENVEFKVTIKCNPSYGDGYRIIESGTEIKGKIFIDNTFIFNF